MRVKTFSVERRYEVTTEFYEEEVLNETDMDAHRPNPKHEVEFKTAILMMLPTWLYRWLTGTP